MVAAMAMSIGLAGWIWVTFSTLADRDPVTALVPFVVLGPASLGALIGGVIASASAEIEVTGSRSLFTRQLVLFVVATVLCAAVLSPALIQRAPYGVPAALRNQLAFSGLGVLGVRMLGASVGWLVPVVYGIGVLSFEGIIRSGDLWAWPTFPSDNATAWAMSLVLGAVGMGLAARSTIVAR